MVATCFGELSSYRRFGDIQDCEINLNKQIFHVFNILVKLILSSLNTNVKC